MLRGFGPTVTQLSFLAVAGIILEICTQPIHSQQGMPVLAEAEALRLGGSASELQKAIAQYREAVQKFEREGDARGEAQAHFGLGQAYDALSDKRQALSSYSQALPLFRKQQDRGREAGTLVHMGLDYDYLGDRKRAVEYAAEALGASELSDSAEVKAEVLTHAGQIYDRAGQKQTALELFQKALPLQQTLHNGRGEATVLSGMGVVYYSEGRTREALENLEPALRLYRAAQDERDEAFTLTSIGAVYYSVDEYRRALDYFQQAQPAWDHCGDRSGASANLHNIASSYERLGELEKAIESFHRALDQHRGANYKIGEANTLTNLGRLHAALGDYSSALGFYMQALPLHQATANKQGEAVTLQNLGDVYGALGEQRKTLEYDLRVLPLRRSIGDRAGEADTLNRIALSYARLGEADKARGLAGEALELFQKVQSPRGEALCQSTLAFAESIGGESAAAAESYRKSIALFESAGDTRGIAAARYGLAREESRQGHLAEAREQAEKAIQISESLRTSVASPELRSFYFASVRDYFDLEIDLLMRLHDRDGRAEFAAAALGMSERARARSLMNLLAERQVDLGEDTQPALRERERALGRQLDATADRYQSLLLSRPADAVKISASLSRLTADYRAVRAEIRAASPRYAALTQPEPLGAAEIEGDVLDADTLLLEYSLGPERSYAWVVSQSSVAGYILPERRVIESAALRFHRLLSTHDPAATKAGHELSRLILDPLAPNLKSKRLAIVADGALQYVPFAALPLPGTSGYQPLLLRSEVVNVPSASALQVLRKEARARPVASKTLAVLADPVFRADDARIPNHAGDPAASPLLARGAESNLARLGGTRVEAETILSLVPPTRRLEALDFDANLATVASPDLTSYRVVHFATHAFVDSEHPEQSRIVLSLVDKSGRPREGILRLHDIYSLRWKSDLVVLSACQTALGQEIQGEGLIGLTRAFMYAGVPRVVASLWQIDDRQTTDLMKYFYQEIFGPGHRAPAAALREAQGKLWAKKGESSLSDWAAFVLTGDWR